MVGGTINLLIIKDNQELIQKEEQHYIPCTGQTKVATRFPLLDGLQIII